MSKKALLITESLTHAHRVTGYLSELDVEVETVLPSSAERLSAEHPDCDLVILDVPGDSSATLARLQPQIMDSGAKSILLLIPADAVRDLRLPMNIASDFIMEDASADEFLTRAGLLLWPGNETSASDIVSVDDLTINLATYQVKVGENPLDLTYLEYALLAFLATHPGKTYSRDMLLKRVWGFDYYGGSRTIDVHVRRVRAKLGPDLAQHLQTIRGVGYLWNL